ncbi:Rrf2 family transcriptional regulator [Fodinibius sp. Rm-B-1B1-1]|uniref:RrF2 family transcriptional regulator n=1 Tax=Fodinibius alkaliphilus TaxID=3140241 RepID=UPI003159B7BB
MLLSSACVYGLRASVYLAAVSGGAYISIKEISSDLDISHHFLTKVLQQLTKADLMESRKGPKGGIRLAHSPGDLTLLEIVAAIDGMDVLTECALGLPGCGSEKPCPIHEKWVDTREAIQKMLTDTSLQELVTDGKDGNLRITADGKFRWD